MKIVCFILSIALLASRCHGQFLGLSFGKCPSIPVAADFSIFNYLGKWYEISKIPNIFEYGLSCNQAYYSPMFDQNGTYIDNQISIENSGVFSFYDWFVYNTTANGIARQPDRMKPNKLKVKFDSSWSGSEGDYNVLDTDYVSYSVVYSCKEYNLLFFSVKNEYAWILSRDLVSSNVTIQQGLSILTGYTDTALLKDTIQDCR